MRTSRPRRRKLPLETDWPRPRLNLSTRRSGLIAFPAARLRDNSAASVPKTSVSLRDAQPSNSGAMRSCLCRGVHFRACELCCHARRDFVYFGIALLSFSLVRYISYAVSLDVSTHFR